MLIHTSLYIFLKKFKPLAPTFRQKKKIQYFNTFNTFNKNFFRKNKYANGRSNVGKILVRHRFKKLETANISIDLKRN